MTESVLPGPQRAANANLISAFEKHTRDPLEFCWVRVYIVATIMSTGVAGIFLILRIGGYGFVQFLLFYILPVFCLTTEMYMAGACLLEKYVGQKLLFQLRSEVLNVVFTSLWLVITTVAACYITRAVVCYPRPSFDSHNLCRDIAL